MSKKLAAFVLLFLIALLGLGFFYKDKMTLLIDFGKQKSISPFGEERSGKIKEPTLELKEWRSPAGFAFLYPVDTQIDSLKEDEVNYAHLNLTKEGKKGKIEIVCTDSQYDNLDEWLKKDKEAKGGSSLDTTIASMSAKRVALSDGKEIAAFIDSDQVIYLLKKDPEGENFWNQAFSAILSSFKLIPLEGESQTDFQQWLGDFDTGGADIVESVEVIE